MTAEEEENEGRKGSNDTLVAEGTEEEPREGRGEAAGEGRVRAPGAGGVRPEEGTEEEVVTLTPGPHKFPRSKAAVGEVTGEVIGERVREGGRGITVDSKEGGKRLAAGRAEPEEEETTALEAPEVPEEWIDEVGDAAEKMTDIKSGGAAAEETAVEEAGTKRGEEPEAGGEPEVDEDPERIFSRSTLSGGR